MRDIRSELLAVLRAIPSWELPEDRWEAVERLLEKADDPDEWPRVVIALTLAAPKRIFLIGDEPVVPPPPVVRERTARQIKEFSAPGEPEKTDDDPR